MNLFLTITLLFLHYTAFTQFTTSIPTEETHLFISEDLISSGYTQVSLVTAQNDPNIQDLLTFGMQYLTEQEILAERLPYAEYEISQILGIYNQVSTGTRYCFDVDITNDQGWVLRATYVIYSQPSTGQKEVTSYVYAVTVNPISGGEEEAPDEEDVGDGFYPIDKAGLEANQELQDALNYGINETTSQGILNHQLPESEYTLVEIYSIYGQMMTSTSYRFDVELRNCAGLTVRTIFIVYFDNELQTYGLTPIYLSITLIPSQGLIGGYCSLDGWPTSEEEVVLGPIWKESDGFISVDFNQSEIDPEIEKALGSGLEEAIAQAVHDGELPDQVYQQDGLYSIEKQAIDGVKYRFDIGLSGDGDVFARVRFVVSYDQGSHTYNLSSYLVVYVEDPAEEPAS